VFYSNRRKQLLLDVNTGKYRKTKGDQPPIIINNNMYELLDRGSEAPGHCFLLRTCLAKDTEQKYDIECSLDSGFRLCLSPKGDIAVIITKTFETSRSRAVMTVLEMKDHRFKTNREGKLVLKQVVLDLEVSYSDFNFNKMAVN
jgi:hypothetical protein